MQICSLVLAATLAIFVGSSSCDTLTVNGAPLAANGVLFAPGQSTPPPEGGVNWLDNRAYTKPAYYPMALPNEASSPNKYYVNMTSGGGSTCSQGSPCATLNAVCGKTTTGGAYIYLKGNGRLDLTSCTLAGTTEVPIVIKPWPSDSTPAVMTAQNGCNVSDANRITASGMSNIIFDGGEDMLFRFVGSGCTSSQNGYTLTVSSNTITLRRVRIDANGSSGPALGPATGSGAATDGFRLINSEIYGATDYYGVYTGGGTSCGAGDTSHTNMEFRNNLIRDVDGRGIQVEPRANSSGMLIDGNVFNNIGHNNSGTSSISGAVQIADACNGTTTGVVVSNNLMWDLGGGGVLIFEGVASDTDFKVYGNTIWDYGKKTPITLNSHAITCFTDGCNADVRNNIILAPANGSNPMNRDSGWATNDNLCESSSGCGSGAIAGTNAATTFVSTSTASASFLFPKGPALAAGVRLTGLDVDYQFGARNNPTNVGAVGP